MGSWIQIQIHNSLVTYDFLNDELYT